MGRIVVFYNDCAHSFDWYLRHGKMAGEIADFSSFFHSVKNFTTAEGGNDMEPAFESEGIDTASVLRKSCTFHRG